MTETDGFGIDGFDRTVERLKRDLAAREAELAEWKRKAEEAQRDAERILARLESEIALRVDSAAIAAKGEA